MKTKLSIAIVSAGLFVLPACKGDEKKADDKTAEKGKAGAEGGDAAAKDAPAAEEKKGAAASAGGGPVANTTKFVPDDAVFLAHIDVKSISSSPMWGANKAAMANDPETKKAMDALAKCNLSVDGFDSITLGGDDKEHAVVVVAGAGIGKADNLACVGESMKDDIGDGNWKVEDKDGEKVVVIDGGAQIGHMVDENTLVVASKDWDGTVKSLIGGDGAAAVDGKLKKAVGNADTSKNLWFAARVPESAGGELKGSPAEGLEFVAGSVDLGDGLGVAIKAGTASPEKAEGLKNFLVTTYGQYKGMAAMVGIPPEVAEKVQFGVAESSATASLDLTKEEVDRIKANMEKMAAGGMGAPGGPPPAAGGAG
jgi:hypothetical protein